MAINQGIIGAALGYSKVDLYPFITTARRYFDGRIVLLVYNFIDEETRKFFLECGVETYEISEVIDPKTINVIRFKYLSDIIDKHPEISSLLVVDTRDVVFQDNPFRNYPLFDLEFFSEPARIKDCRSNSEWVMMAYGPDCLSRMGENNIVCAGSTMGSADALSFYFKKMLAELSRLASSGNLFGFYDQVVHNYLIYSGAFRRFRINHTWEGAVATLHHSANLTFDRDGYLLNNDGKGGRCSSIR